MEQSILTSTKAMAGIDSANTAFDLEVTTQINSVFSDLKQLGVGNGTPIEDDQTNWNDLPLEADLLNWVKTYVAEKVKLAFDPPGTSFLIDAAEKRMREIEFRIHELVEEKKGPRTQEEVETV